MFNLSKRSLNNLSTVHPDLVRLVIDVIKTTSVAFAVIEGRRTLERQKELVSQGKSQTLYSRHLTGHAIDFLAYVNNIGTWEIKYYAQIAATFKQVSSNLHIPIIWGGDWVTFKDFDHIELDKKVYP